MGDTEVGTGGTTDDNDNGRWKDRREGWNVYVDWFRLHKNQDCLFYDFLGKTIRRMVIKRIIDKGGNDIERKLNVIGTSTEVAFKVSAT